MVRSMFAGVAGLRAHQQKMDVIGNNIANVNTTGYKCATFNFKESMYSTTLTGGNGGTQAGLKGGTNASQVGYGTTLGSITRDYNTGSPTPTGRGLDCMIDGTGFFVVGGYDDAGIAPGSIQDLYLTRVGIFTVDGNGFLTDSQGNYVYGYSPQAPTTAGGAVEFDKTALNMLDCSKAIDKDGNTIVTTGANPVTLESYSIDANGVLTGVGSDKKTYTIGKLALAAVENVNGLEATEGYYYKAGPNAGNVVAKEAGEVGNIRSSYLEMPNVDLAQQFAEMITTQRGFQANSKIITVTDEMLQELVNMKR